MSNEEIDRVLAGDDGLAPSSGFTSNVMDAIRRDAEAPPPIPFPWKRALPGFIVCGLGAGLLLAGGGSRGAAEIQVDSSTGWILAALLVTVLSVALSMRLAGRRG